MLGQQRQRFQVVRKDLQESESGGFDVSRIVDGAVKRDERLVRGLILRRESKALLQAIDGQFSGSLERFGRRRRSSAATNCHRENLIVVGFVFIRDQ